MDPFLKGSLLGDSEMVRIEAPISTPNSAPGRWAFFDEFGQFGAGEPTKNTEARLAAGQKKKNRKSISWWFNIDPYTLLKPCYS